MSELKELFERFLTEFGEGISDYGFPRKILRRTYFFQKKIPDGYIGIHINQIYHSKIDIDIIIQIAVSIDYVQNRITKTEYYGKPDSSLTWSFGIDIYNLIIEGNFVPPIPAVRYPDGRIESRVSDVLDHAARYGSHRYKIRRDGGDADVRRVVHDTLVHIREYGLPFFQAYGSETGTLELCLRDDDLADACFTDGGRKQITGMLLARKFGDEKTVAKLIEMGRKKCLYYKANGNPEPLAQFERVATQLGFSVEDKRPRFLFFR